MKKIIFLLVFGISIPNLKAQNSLSMVTTDSAYWFPAAVVLGSTISFPVKVKNNLATPFNDSIDIYVAVDTGAIIPSLSIIKIESVLSTTILAFDTSTYSILNVFINPSIFSEGSNTVVIWPIYPNGGSPPSDSLFNETQAFLGINYLENKPYPKTFPNPTTGIVQFNNLKKPLEEVRIYGANGKLVKIFKSVANVDITNYPPGYYFINFIFEDKLIIEKIIKK
jgi:hypothetical protein